MQTRNIEIIVGAFMLAGILSVAWLGIQVSGLTMQESTGTYKLTAYFNNIGGLTERGKVTIARVLFGRVASIDLDPISVRARVGLHIVISVGYIPDDSIASITIAVVLGRKGDSKAIVDEED